jgi:hypothetical protein
MTARRPCPAAPGPLEDYAAQFDRLLGTLANGVPFASTCRGSCFRVIATKHSLR